MKKIAMIIASLFFAVGCSAAPSKLQSSVSDVSSFNLKSAKNGTVPKVKLNSGYEMPILGLGTYSLHGEVCKNAVKSALSQGYRLIDTAYMYGNEKEIGEAIREFMAESGVSREEIFLITKIYPGEQFSNPEKAIQDALDKLDIGYIDMMLLHHTVDGTCSVELWQFLAQVIHHT